MCCTRTSVKDKFANNKIDKTSENPLCRMCGERGETVQHIICECKKLAQCEYKRRHDTAGASGTSIALKELGKVMTLN